ncbi:MAG: aminodeoxychorismate synthase component I [Flavobacteriaceae bacterium]
MPLWQTDVQEFYSFNSMGVNAFVEQMNIRAKEREPFFFLIDFEKKKPLLLSWEEAKRKEIYFQINNYQNFDPSSPGNSSFIRSQKKISQTVYRNAFEKVQKHLKQGDTYLLNLTFPTPIDLEGSLLEVFHTAQSPQKLYVKDHFVCFSPETFIQIKNDQIATFPMKGTADADDPTAADRLLNNTKELWEHSTTVDLLRNDLAIHAHHIQVEQFRYLDTIRTSKQNLFQASSKITGKLPSNWREKLGDILWDLLPAGSISGAPKIKTLAIIQEAEIDPRGYYTGVYGIFDGDQVHSAVAIRYIEQQGNSYCYRSGGGITAKSRWKEEYQELQQKIYVPTI